MAPAATAFQSSGSGFVIYLTTARDGDFGSVRSFAIRQVARLVPPYYVTLLIALFPLSVVPSPLEMPGAGAIATHFAVLQTPALLFA